MHSRGSLLLPTGDNLRDARGDHRADDGALQRERRVDRRRRRVQRSAAGDDAGHGGRAGGRAVRHRRQVLHRQRRHDRLRGDTGVHGGTERDDEGDGVHAEVQDRRRARDVEEGQVTLFVLFRCNLFM